MAHPPQLSLRQTIWTPPLPFPLQKPKPTLTVATSSDSFAVTAGDEVSLTVTISNEGTVGVTGVTFVLTLPTEVTWVVEPAADCTVDDTTGDYTCTLGDLADATPKTVSITGTPASAGSLAISGTVAATNVDPADCTNCSVNVPVEIAAA